MPLPVPSSDLIKKIQAAWATIPSMRGYVAPSVFLQKGNIIPRLNYYKTASAAFNKLLHLNNDGGKNETPAGTVDLKPDGSVQTIGINCDYFIAISRTLYVEVPYGIVKTLIEKNVPFAMFFRFYTIAGAGPYFAVFSTRNFGISATRVDSYKEEKVKALDELYRSANIVKANYNALVSFLNSMAARPSLTPAEQQMYNRGNNMRVEMLTKLMLEKNFTITYGSAGQVGFVFLAPIVWIAIAGAVAGWAVSKIVESVNNTKRIYASYDFLKWKTEEEKNIAILEKEGKISANNATALRTGLNQAAVQAGEVLNNASESKSMFGEIKEVLLWGGLIYVGAMVLPKLLNANSKP